MVDHPELRSALAELAELASRIDADDADVRLGAVLDRILVDALGVALAGARTPEFQSLVSIWPLPGGTIPIWGTGLRSDVQTAALLVGTALCTLELDEGNKAARGHPGAHVIPAALAEAWRLGRSGPELRTAILAGYEVAARFAAAFRPRAGLHPHGHWGALGAAVAVGRLHGFDARGLAEAIDAAAALPLATPFSSALDGSYVRNTWVGAAGSNGITAVRLVQAGLGSVETTAAKTFGSLLGEVEPEKLLVSGERWTITEGYFKRHAACAYTHPPADAAIALREELAASGTGRIQEILVETHSLAAPLDRPDPVTRLAAMFSIPHVVAVALRHGAVLPEHFDEPSRQDPELARLRSITRIRTDPAIDAALPARRGARVTVITTAGTAHTIEVPNAVGDSDHRPFGDAEIAAKLTSLIGTPLTAEIVAAVDSLRAAGSVPDALEPLALFAWTRQGEE